jgi:hypothetical protein
VKSKIIIGFLLASILSATPLFAQSRGRQDWRAMRAEDLPCWKHSEFAATAEQLKSLDDLHRSYVDEVKKYRDRYLSLRFEIRGLLSNPEPNTLLVIEKQKELSALEKEFHERSLEYFLKGRAIFRFEQISRLPYNCRLGFNYGAEVGGSRIWGHGKGWGRGK